MTELVFIDDGSTATKFAQTVDGEIKFKTYTNRAELGYGMASEDCFTYEIDGSVMTFSESCDAVKTGNIQYQYSDHSVGAIHHALHQAGFSGQEIDVIVTLPISEFYFRGRVNEENIEKKKKNVLKAVKPEYGEQITIKNVYVYPEGIPAVEPLIGKNGTYKVAADELVLLVDIGGTTLDLALFSGGAKKLSRAQSYTLGMFDTFPLIREAINRPNARDVQVANLLETGKAAGGRITVDRLKVVKPVMQNIVLNITDFLGKDIDNTSHVFIVGGGSAMVSHYLEEAGIKNIVIDEPAHALVKAIANIEMNRKA